MCVLSSRCWVGASWRWCRCTSSSYPRPCRRCSLWPSRAWRRPLPRPRSDAAMSAPRAPALGPWRSWRRPHDHGRVQPRYLDMEARAPPGLSKELPGGNRLCSKRDKLTVTHSYEMQSATIPATISSYFQLRRLCIYSIWACIASFPSSTLS
jgi:hypothetical protein